MQSSAATALQRYEATQLLSIDLSYWSYGGEFVHSFDGSKEHPMWIYTPQLFPTAYSKGKSPLVYKLHQCRFLSRKEKFIFRLFLVIKSACCPSLFFIMINDQHFIIRTIFCISVFFQ